MAFSDFKTIPEVLETFQITYVRRDFVKSGAVATPSEHFLQDFEFNQQYIDVFASEGARCEAIIFPVLREVYKAYAKDYALWIKKSIVCDETLSGIPDYFIATRSKLGIPDLTQFGGKPLIMMVAAKQNDFEQGWGQCLAELIAAQKINDDAATPVHGIVTDGKLWEFGRLVGDIFTRNRTSFTSDNLPVLLGAVDSVFDTATGAPIEE